MARRKVLLTLGGASAIGSAVLGTDAFSSVSADRAIAVDVAGDAKALLALEPASGSNGAYATLDDGTLEIDLSTDDAEGVNAQATTVARDVFKVTNRGTQDVGVWISHDSEYVTFTADGSPVESEDSSVLLGPGESTTIGLTVDTTGAEAGETLLEEMTVHATADVEKTPAGGGGSDLSFETSRSLSTTTASPGDGVGVTVEVELTARRDVDVYERFEAGLGTVSLEGVTVDGTSVSPSFADVEDNGGIVLLSNVGPGTVAVDYEIAVADSGGSFEGYVVVDGERQPIGDDTVEVN